VQDHSKFFHIHDLRVKKGSWEAIYAIDLGKIAADFISEYLRELTKNLAVEAALATKLGFVYLVHRSYKAWKERCPLPDRVFDRDEAILTEALGNHAPMLGIERERDAQRRRLFERTNSSMSKVTAPIGRAATRLDIWLDDVHLDLVERRFYSDEEIAAALLPVRAQWNVRPHAFAQGNAGKRAG
jgi:hypothetical protein